ncbi:MAG: 50S ribosomal protein L29 [Patescibacteria group bacterium]
MELAELKEKSVAELNELLKEQSASLRDHRFKVASGQMKTFNKISEAKKIVARIQTILTQRSIAADTK